MSRWFPPGLRPAGAADGRQAQPAAALGGGFDQVVRQRRAEADEFYAELTPEAASADEAMVMRQAFAGMLWGEQLYNYDVARWLDGDPAQILTRRNRQAGGDDAQRAAGVTEEPLGPEHLRDGRDSSFSSRAASMTGVPRTPIGREDRRRWIGSDSVRMTIPQRISWRAPHSPFPCSLAAEGRAVSPGRPSPWRLLARARLPQPAQQPGHAARVIEGGVGGGPVRGVSTTHRKRCHPRDLRLPPRRCAFEF